MRENQRPGTAGWRPTRTSEEVPFSLYLSRNSIAAGEPLQVFASARIATSCRLEVFRLGYYAGAGARRVLFEEGVPVPAQGWWTPAAGLQAAPAAVVDHETGLLDCHWAPVARIVPGPDWISGSYVVRLTEPGGSHCGSAFVLRDDDRPGALLVMFPTFTHQAYNGWGGKSLYGYTSHDRTPVFGKTRAVRVSFNRPYARASGMRELLDCEPQFVRWVERQGYDVSYCTDTDLHRRADLWSRSRGLLCIGHAEYWTAQMVDHALAARDAGRHLAFLGGNDVYWQIRLEPDAASTPDRTVVCYKRAAIDPQRDDPRAVTVRFADSEVARPQSILTGTVYGSELWPFTQDWVASADHWLLDHTDLRPGDRIKNLVGREYDRVGRPDYTPANLTVLASSPVSDAHGGYGTASSTLYQWPSGAFVFSAGTVYWSRALVEESPTFDWRAGQISANLLDRFMQRP